MNLYIIIKYILYNIYYNKYYNYIININNIKYNNKSFYKLLLTVKQLKEEHPKEIHSVQDLSALFQANYPFLPESERLGIDAILEKADTVEVDTNVAEKLFDSYLKQAQAERIAETAIEVTQGRQDWAKLEALFTVPEITTNEDVDFMSTDLEEIYEKELSEKGLKFRLKTLGKILGSLRLGDFGFIFARPEVGKTTFLASEVTYLGTQTDSPILWVNNEQRGSAVIPRCYSAYFGVTEAEIQKDLPDFNAKWKSTLGMRFKFIDNPGITRNRIDAICRALKPGLIVFDQLDKVHGFDAERYDLIMKQKYQWARELAKQYGPVIGVCQAGGTAENKRYLEMNDVDSSHTAKQGEADWIVGIGKSNDAGLHRIRYLSVCKNKLPGDVDTIPDMRHAKVEVFINEQNARYEDKIKW